MFSLSSENMALQKGIAALEDALAKSQEELEDVICEMKDTHLEDILELK